MASAQASLTSSRHSLANLQQTSQHNCVAKLLASLQGEQGLEVVTPLPWNEADAQRQAVAWVGAMRDQRVRAWGLDALMQEYALSSTEGVALMCLAEGLLRIPDNPTRDRLIRDALQRGDWSLHLGRSPSWFVNAATWGLVLAKYWVRPATKNVSQKCLEAASRSLLAKGGDGLLRHAITCMIALLGEQFVMAKTIEEATHKARQNDNQDLCYSFDVLGEAAVCADDAQHYFEFYMHAIHTVGQHAVQGKQDNGVSIKLSALHPRYELAQQERVQAELYPRLLALTEAAKYHGIGLTLDAEESERLELSLLLLERLCFEPSLSNWDGLGCVVQAYQTRALGLVDHLALLASLAGRVLNVRLVKGAYWDSEIKKAQQQGLSHYPVFTDKAATDLSFLACAHRLVQHSHVLYAQFATHNALSCAQVLSLVKTQGLVHFEMQGLFGMGQALYQQVLQSHPGLKCRLYAPVGAHHSLLPYLVRRLLENGANSSFVNQVLNPNLNLDVLLQSPVAVCQHPTQCQPKPSIVLPQALYLPGRDNSVGLDLHNQHTLSTLELALCTLDKHEWCAAPLLGIAQAIQDDLPFEEAQVPRVTAAIKNPAQCKNQVGVVQWSTLADVEHAVALAQAEVPHWAHTTAAHRAELLLRVAQEIHNSQAMLLSLMVREAGKTIPAALAEWREAIDFCRYYAQELLALGCEGALACTAGNAGGVAACIGPWNFPLAIVMGQVASALAAGLCVVVKPAEQTPLIAHYVIGLCHQAGIGRNVLQCVPGDGPTIGAALARHSGVDTVLFTGSLAAARQVAALQLQAFKKRMAVFENKNVRFPLLVAETGGVNAMVVDASALLEQVVADVLLSAFDSAGQRCSALRLLCIQSDVAERLLALIRGAMAELTVGNPAKICTDIGPLIDTQAANFVRNYIAQMQAKGNAVYQAGRLQIDLYSGQQDHGWVQPTLIQVASVDDVGEEVFGPVLHVCTFLPNDMPKLLTQIASKGYGLTFGVHSRLQQNIDACVHAVPAGNVYINRNMVGAVVGTQPFGGLGLSGTGPKAGGPFMLPRLMRLEPVKVLDAGLSQTAQTLPGPTGEINTWQLQPRGLLWCSATNPEALRLQVELMQRTGNTACVLQSDWADRGAVLDAVLADWPPALQKLVQVLPNWPSQAAAIAGVVVERQAQRYLAVMEQVLQHCPVLLPVVLQNHDGIYPALWAYCEQVQSNNTAAMGGNVALMSME